MTKFKCLFMVAVLFVAVGADSVDEYDVGANEDKVIAPEDRIPEGKADILVVLGARWCGPCIGMKANWPLLRAQGYKVVYIDVDDPKAGNEANQALVKKYMAKYKKRVPVLYWHNSQTGRSVRETHKAVSTRSIKETLWKKSSSPDSGPERQR